VCVCDCVWNGDVIFGGLSFFFIAIVRLTFSGIQPTESGCSVSCRCGQTWMGGPHGGSKNEQVGIYVSLCVCDVFFLPPLMDPLPDPVP